MNKLLLGIALLLFCTFSVLADRVENEPITITQPWGTKINVLLTGDEFYNYLHDRYNFTIVQDDKGIFRYALVQDGKLVPSAFVVGKDDPLMSGLQPGATVSIEEYQRLKYEFLGHDELAYKSLTMGDDTEVFQTGDFNNVVILIRFTDSPEFVGETALTNLFNKDGVKSVKEYYNKVSYGKLNMVSNFLPRNTEGNVITFDAPKNYTYYNQSNATRRELFKAAIDFANAHATGFSANIDKDNNGRVDNVSFVLNHKRLTAWGTPLWPHKSYYGGASLFGKTVGTYYLAYTADSYRTHVHEMFHVLSAPDLYHYTGNGISPAGSWDLMQSSGGHMMSYMKKRYGKWVDNIDQIDESGKYYLKSVGKSDVDNAYYIKPDKNKNELFYMEYRNNADDIFESTLPGSGIIFYRILPNLHGNAQGPPDMLYVFRPNGSAIQNGSINKAHFSAQSGRTIFDPGSNPSPFFNDGSAAEFRVHTIGNAGGDSISFNLDFEHIDNFKTSNTGEDFLSLEWDKQDSVIMVCSRKPISGSPVKGETYSVGDVISDGSQVIYLGSGNNYTHNNLKPGTFYYYKIWIVDALYGSYIGSAKTDGFTNSKAIIDQYPFYTSFEQDTIDKLPVYWKGYSDNAYGSWDVKKEKPLVGENTLKFGMYINGQLLKSNFEANARTMAFRMEAGKEYSISYGFKALYNEQTMLSVSKKGDGTGLIQLYSNSFSGLSWSKHSVNFIPDEDTLYYIYFGAKGYQAYGAQIDEVLVEAESPLPMPSALTAVFANDSAIDLSWTETGSATKWELKHGPKGFDPEIGGKYIKDLSSKLFRIENLKPASAYDWYVRAVKDGEASYWAGAGHFTTMHPETEAIERMYETFEDVEVPGLPSFWRQFLFTGTSVWGSEEVEDEKIASVKIFDELAETWMITKPLNIQNIANPYISYLQKNFGYEREAQELIVSMDYDGLGDPRNFTWTILEDSVYEYGSMYHMPLDLTAFKGARSLYVGWRMKTKRGGMNFWEVDNVSISDKYTINAIITDKVSGAKVEASMVKDMFGNTMATSDVNGKAVFDVTYQQMNVTICHEMYEDYVIENFTFNKNQEFNIALTPRVKVDVEVVDKSTGTALANALIKRGSQEYTTDASGKISFYTNSGTHFSGWVCVNGYNDYNISSLVNGNVTLKVELTQPMVELDENTFNVDIDWGDTTVMVVIRNTGNGPAKWFLNSDFTDTETAYSGINDEGLIWYVAASKRYPELSYLIKASGIKPDSILSHVLLDNSFKSIEFDNHLRLFGVTQFGRYIVGIDTETGKADTLLNGINLNVRFDELVVNRYNNTMFALGGDPYDLNDKQVYKLANDSVESIKTLDKKDLGLFFTGDSKNVMGSIAIQGTWKIEADGKVPGRYPRSYAMADLSTGWNAAENSVVVYSSQVGANSKIYRNSFGAISVARGAYTNLGAGPDSVSVLCVAASARLNDWFSPLASEGMVEAQSTDTLKIRIYNDIPNSANLSVKGIVSTHPEVGVFTFDVNASLRGYTGITKVTPKGFNVYPNPSSGLFIINGLEGSITVYNVLGKQVKTQRITKGGTLNMINETNGLYFVKHAETGFVFKIEKQ